MIARGELDFSLLCRACSSSPGCRRADHGAGGCACRMLRAVRARAHPNHQRSEGQEGRHRCSGLEQAPATWRSWRRMSGSTPTRTSNGSTRNPTRSIPMELFAERKVDAFLAIPARAAGAARPQDRSRDPQHDHGQAMVAVFLLHAGRQQRTFVRNHPVATKRVLRAILKATDICASRAGARRATAGRARVRGALRLRAADADGAVRTRAGASSTPRTRCASTRCGCTRSA